MEVEVKLLSRVRLFPTPLTVAYKPSLSISMDCIIQGVEKSQTGLRDGHFHSINQIWGLDSS